MSDKFKLAFLLPSIFVIYKKFKQKKTMKIEQQIEILRTKLTGNLLEDGEIQQEIYELKKQLNPRIENNPEEDTDDYCLTCGS